MRCLIKWTNLTLYIIGVNWTGSTDHLEALDIISWFWSDSCGSDFIILCYVRVNLLSLLFSWLCLFIFDSDENSKRKFPHSTVSCQIVPVAVDCYSLTYLCSFFIVWTVFICHWRGLNGTDFANWWRLCACNILVLWSLVAIIPHLFFINFCLLDILIKKCTTYGL